MITPMLVNNIEWHIDGEPDNPQLRKLAEHIKQLFITVLPPDAETAYELRISCGYAFALAEGIGNRPDLLVPLPVTLGPRQAIEANANMLEATEKFRQNLEAAIRKWWAEHQPSTSKGVFVFKLSILSSKGKLPLLRIDDLRLALKNIDDL